MKRVLAGLMTIVVVIIVATIAKRQPTIGPGIADSPTDCVDRMFAAAAQGDVAGYRECFDGPQLAAIQRDLGVDDVAAAASLRSTMAELRGWAIVDPPPENLQATACSLVLERVYSGRVDRQRLELEKSPRGWKIHRVDRSQAFQPPVAYGTPIYAEPPSVGAKEDAARSAEAP